jgi:hypothetical protein
MRVVLGILGVFFCYALGRVIVRMRRDKLPLRKALTWFLRVTVCVFGVLWNRGLDATSIIVLVAAVLSLAGGAYLELRPRHVEETHLFPGS